MLSENAPSLLYIRLRKLIPLLGKSVRHDESTTGTKVADKANLRTLELKEALVLSSLGSELLELLPVVDPASVGEPFEQDKNLGLVFRGKTQVELFGGHFACGVVCPFYRPPSPSRGDIIRIH
jgi:hypothetical protein